MEWFEKIFYGKETHMTSYTHINYSLKKYSKGNKDI
jgi:hypothetical protein